MDGDDDFDFEVDAFDELPAEALHQLESQALFTSTQKQRPIAAQQPPTARRADEDDFHFEDEDIIDLDAEPISISRATKPTAPVRAPHAASRQPEGKVLQLHNGPSRRPSGPRRNGLPADGTVTGSQALLESTPSSTDVDVRALLEQVQLVCPPSQST